MKRGNTNATASFKFWDGFADSIQSLDEFEGAGVSFEEIEWAKREFTYDLTLYGCYGVPINFDKYGSPVLRAALRTLFIPMRPSIDKSAAGSKAGRRGGRGNKTDRDLEELVKYHEDPNTMGKTADLDVDISRDLADTYVANPSQWA